MADINVERKRGRGIWPWILGLLLLGALLFLLSRCSDDEEAAPVTAVDTVTTATTADTAGMGATGGGAPMPMTDTAASAAAGGTDSIPVAQLVSGATAGQSVSGLTRVTEVVSDRGFWISQGGQRMFAVVGEPQASEQAVDINAGQVLRMSGQVVQGGAGAQLPGQVEAETRRIAEQQPFFVTVQPRDVQVVSGG